MSVAPNQFVLIGVAGTQADQVASELSRVLAIEFDERDSDYQGIYYKWVDSSSDEEISVKRNWLDNTSELLESEYLDFEVLIYIDDSSRADSIVHILQHSKLSISVLREELI